MLYLLLTWLLLPWLKWKAGRGKKEVSAILVIQTAKIGDMICSTPIFTALKATYPQARLYVLADPVTEPIIRANEVISAVLSHKPREFKGWKGRLKLYCLLRENNIDTVVCLSPNQVYLSIPLWKGVPRRLSVLPPGGGGFSYRLASSFLSCGEHHRPGRSFLDTCFSLLYPLGVVPLYKKHVPVLKSARSKMTGLLPVKNGLWAGLGISSGNKLKALDEQQLQQFITGLLARGYTVVLVGSKEDTALAQQLKAGFPGSRVIDSTGLLNLAELSALIECMDLYVGVDSGITYMADALGIPLIDIMGPADPQDQAPNGSSSIVISPVLPCAPCSHAFDAPYECKMKHRHCVTEIVAETILRELDKRSNAILDK